MFEADDKIREIAEACSLDAVDHANNAGIQLDWSDQSIEKVEEILRMLHQEMTAAKPSTEQVRTFAQMYGSYTGEVFRKNHGGTWGMVTIDGNRFPGMEATNTTVSFWPWGRVQNRILNGPEDNVWHYYQALLRQIEPAEGPASRHVPPEQIKRRHWWWFW
jgi:hypothetical protein